MYIYIYIIYIYTGRKYVIYHEFIGGLVKTVTARCMYLNIFIHLYIYLYIYKYIDVTLYLSQNMKAGKVFETTQYYGRCSSRKLNVVCR